MALLGLMLQLSACGYSPSLSGAVTAGSFVPVGAVGDLLVTEGSLLSVSSLGIPQTDFNANGAGFNGSVYTVLNEEDGDYIIVGGSFTSYNGIAVSGLARVAYDGTLDETFNSGTGFDGGTVKVIISRKGLGGNATGDLYIGGDFTTKNGEDVPDNLIRVNAFGDWDNSFNNSGSGFDYEVKDIIQRLETNGRYADEIIVVGDFTQYNGANCPLRAMELDNTGADTGFGDVGKGLTGSINSVVQDINPSTGLPTLVYYFAGSFESYNTGMGIINIPDGIARTDSSGTLTTTTWIGAMHTGTVAKDLNDIIVEYGNDGDPSGYLLIGGNLTSFGGVAVESMARIARTDGTVDTTYMATFSGFTGEVLEITQMVDPYTTATTGTTFVVGDNLLTDQHFIALNRDGDLDTSFEGADTYFDDITRTIVQKIGSYEFWGGGDFQ